MNDHAVCLTGELTGPLGPALALGSITLTTLAWACRVGSVAASPKDSCGRSSLTKDGSAGGFLLAGQSFAGLGDYSLSHASRFIRSPLLFSHCDAAPRRGTGTDPPTMAPAQFSIRVGTTSFSDGRGSSDLARHGWLPFFIRSPSYRIVCEISGRNILASWNPRPSFRLESTVLSSVWCERIDAANDGCLSVSTIAAEYYNMSDRHRSRFQFFDTTRKT